jgi:hypothetical protein
MRDRWHIAEVTVPAYCAMVIKRGAGASPITVLSRGILQLKMLAFVVATDVLYGILVKDAASLAH